MSPPRYIATIANVREVSLIAEADADFWADHVRDEGLTPYRKGDRAELTLSAPRLSWMGLRFSELIVVLTLGEPADPSRRRGAWLVAAFNTNPLLAWSERTFFKTGYRSGFGIDADCDREPGFALRPASRNNGDTPFISARRGPGDRDEEQTDDLWEEPVHLPRYRSFHVKISGPTRTSAFVAEMDEWKLAPSIASPLPQWLIDSRCRPTQWKLRPNAVHARSKTIARPLD